MSEDNGLEGIAIIGMSARFPKSDTIYSFWDNLINGRDCITTILPEEARLAGISESIINSKQYVGRCGRITKPEYFDASFFGFNPKEASFTDPQHRIFLQCGYEALESAGYNVKQLENSVGVFASCGMNYYFINNLINNPNASNGISELQMLIGNDKDFLSTRLSYKLNLRGPSYDIQTACSSSLVAVHVACQNLLTYQCDMALAGGANLGLPWWYGYFLSEGDIRSADGICRPFDANANGTVFGEGTGAIVLKRLADAINDRDHIYAVIKGSAVNNDGSGKAGYTAPSIEGQSEVIMMALESADISASEISYVETHGTGTHLGDPVEISALTKAFRQYTNNTNYCAIGSVKSTIGHLDTTSGVAGLIKTALALHHKTIPLTLNFNTPNPLLDIDKTPFFVASKTTQWAGINGKCRAGISSLGVGGTNAHVILEEAPAQNQIKSSKTWHFIPFSARSPEALKNLSVNLSNHLSSYAPDIADTAFTLQTGRQAFPYKQFVIARTPLEASELLKNSPVNTASLLAQESNNKKIVFMFSGQGSQYIDMGKGLYNSDKLFKNVFDKCSDILNKHISIDLRDLLFSTENMLENSIKISQTNITQPLLFSFEYALVKVWESVGITPSALIGHSIGEYVAACISGVFTLEEALYIVTERGRLMHNQPAGSMMSVNIPEQDLIKLIDKDIEIALINAPNQCVVAGSTERLDIFQNRLSDLNIEARRLHTSHAFHSSLMDGAVQPFIDILKTITIKPPSIPYISNVTGDWVQFEEIKDPVYWGRHIRNSVKFSDGINKLLQDGFRTFVEIGPGNTLASFVNKTFSYKTSASENASTDKIAVAASVRHVKQEIEDVPHFLNAIGQLWQNGINIQWKNLYPEENRFRVPLPTYPFEQKKFWINSVNHSFFGFGNQSGISTTDQENGTLDKTEFAESDSTSTFSDKPEAVISAVQKTIESIWKDLLGLDIVNPSQSFFELGGDSIWATQMLARIREKTGVDVSISILYKSPSLLEFTKEIEALKKDTVPSSISRPIRSDTMEGIPLSSAQLRLWFLYQLEPESPAFNLASEFTITGPFNFDFAKRTIDALAERHDALRMTFEDNLNGPTIQIQSKIDYDFETIDLSDLAITDSSKWISEIRKRSTKPYNLQTGPLFRILIIRLGENHHILSIMSHHIISDGWSIGVFLRDFTAYYASLVTSKNPAFPELSLRFADYIMWQLKNSPSSENPSMEYWKAQLSGVLPILELPSEKIRPPALTYSGSCVHFSLRKETSKKLAMLSKKEQTTTFSSLLSIFYILLSKYSGQNDIVIGAPVANRNNIEIENMIGFFLNMIPLRIRCGQTNTYQEILQSIAGVVREAFEHQNISFDLLVETLKPQRDMSHPPIFQVMFAYQNFPIEPSIIDDTTITPLLVDRGATEYDLSLYMWNSDEILSGIFEYSTDIFDRDAVERLTSHFVNIAEKIAESIDIPINKIDMLSNEERTLIIDTWNKTDTEFPEHSCVHDLFIETASDFSSSNAVISRNRSYTYKELNDASDRIAIYLSAKGITSGDLVGISLERHFEMIAALMAILKVGAAYVPLDPNYPKERLAYMVEDSGLRFIITQDNLKSSLPTNHESIQLICIEPELNNLPLNSAPFKPVKVSTENIAYIIYTSGSTGKPKGVRIPHRAVVNFLKSMVKKPGICASDVVMAVTTLSFDISVLEILLPLTTGACCVVVENETIQDGGKLIALIEEVKPTIMQGTPSLWRLLIASGWKGHSRLKALCGGEPLPYDLIRELLPKVNELWNMYGPTETTVWATCFQILNTQDPVFIGYPITNMKTYILDNTMQPLPVGVAGELFIGGTGLAEGYHNRPDLTAERFIKNPFSDGRIYRTGDLARYRNTGAIEFMGRIDSQVKIRGFRIEIGEIEQVTLNHQEVRQCAAICKEVSPGDMRLLLFFTLKSVGSITVSDLRKHLKSFLPEYMVPQHFVEMDSLPLTPAGKIDKKALPLPFQSDVQNKDSQSEIKTEAEIYLADIWKQVLKVDKIQATDNFYNLGGHSLLSIKVIAQVKKETGIEIHPRSMILNTLEQIAANHPFKNLTSDVPEVVQTNKVSLLKKITGFFK